MQGLPTLRLLAHALVCTYNYCMHNISVSGLIKYAPYPIKGIWFMFNRTLCKPFRLDHRFNLSSTLAYARPAKSTSSLSFLALSVKTGQLSMTLVGMGCIMLRLVDNASVLRNVLSANSVVWISLSANPACVHKAYACNAPWKGSSSDAKGEERSWDSVDV
jgi:hypothetical protein